MSQRLIPGVGWVDATRSASGLVPGRGYVLEDGSTTVTVALSGPTKGQCNTASTNFTVTISGAIGGNIVITPTAVAGCTFTPTSLTLSSGTPSGTFTVTPTTAGVKSIAVTNDGGWTNPNAINYTAYRVLSVTLNDRSGAVKSSLTGLRWAFFDQATPDLFLTPVSKGSTGTTDGSGVFYQEISATSLGAGGVGWLIISDSDGTANVASNAVSCPVTVT